MTTWNATHELVFMMWSIQMLHHLRMLLFYEYLPWILYTLLSSTYNLLSCNIAILFNNSFTATINRQLQPILMKGKRLDILYLFLCLTPEKSVTVSPGPGWCYTEIKTLERTEPLTKKLACFVSISKLSRSFGKKCMHLKSNCPRN